MYNYKKGDMVKGKVTGIEKYGIFVSINDGVTGLIHISEIYDAFVKNTRINGTKKGPQPCHIILVIRLQSKQFMVRTQAQQLDGVRRLVNPYWIYCFTDTYRNCERIYRRMQLFWT